MPPKQPRLRKLPDLAAIVTRLFSVRFCLLRGLARMDTILRHNDVNYGLGMGAFEKAYESETGKEVSFPTVAGYTEGLIIGKTLATADSLGQLALRKAVASLSGKLKTLDGLFQIRADGAQVGETIPLGQFLGTPSPGASKLEAVSPPELATAKAVYPAPAP